MAKSNATSRSTRLLKEMEDREEEEEIVCLEAKMSILKPHALRPSPHLSHW